MAPAVLRALLAGLCAFERRRAAYAAALLRARAAGADNPPAAVGVLPSPDHWRQADAMGEALRCLQLTAIPVWAFPAWARAVRPLPPCLFVRGAPATLAGAPAIAIVGSRRASPGPLAWAFDLARQAARQGFVVVSGGALGIDRAAHEGALAAGGRTLAWLGTAIDRPYPRINDGLFARILRHGGALASEHPPLSATFASDHAARNRLIVGRARALCVAEAGTHSGTMGAARTAHRRGVPLFVPPADVGGERGGIDALCERGQASVWRRSTPFASGWRRRAAAIPS